MDTKLSRRDFMKLSTTRMRQMGSFIRLAILDAAHGVRAGWR